MSPRSSTAPAGSRAAATPWRRLAGGTRIAAVSLLVLCAGLAPAAPQGRGRAAERAGAIASLSIGSAWEGAAPFRPEVFNQVLGGLIGGKVALGAADYESLFRSQLAIVDLIAARDGVRSTAQLLALELTTRQLLGLLAAALEQRGDPVSRTLRALAKVADAPGVARIGDWLHIAAGSEDSALEAMLSVLDLVRASALAASGRKLLSFDSLPDAAPGVARAGIRALVLQPPTIAVGPPGQDAGGAWRTEVRSPQIRVELALEGASRVAGLGNVPLTLTAYLASGEAIARLRGIECGKRASVTAVAAPGHARMGIGSFTEIESGDLAAPAHLAELKLLGAPVVRLTAANEVELQSPAETLVFQGPFARGGADFEPAPSQLAGTALRQAIDGAVAQLGNELVVRVVRLGAVPVGFSQGRTASEAESILNALLKQVPEVLTPVLQAFGVQVGGAEIRVLSVHGGAGERC